jgi:hypothetical protein
MAPLGKGYSHDQVCEDLKRLRLCRCDSKFGLRPIHAGGYRRPCEKMSGAGSEGSSDSESGNQGERGRESPTRLLPGLPLQRSRQQIKTTHFGMVATQKGSIMTNTQSSCTQSSWLLVGLLLLASAASASAQPTDGNNAAQIGTSGAPVSTGHGPLSQPVPPAVSTANPRQNFQQGAQRPQNSVGPVQTKPSQQPFGSR